MHYVRRGKGKPLLLIHGLGGSWRSWSPILDDLALEREVIASDLPGFGKTPPLAGEVSIRTLDDALTEFLRTNNLIGVDAVGSSTGARLVLELARRGGVLGAVVSLDPGGFWRGWQRHFFFVSIAVSIRLVRLLQPIVPLITGNALGRTLLFAQLSAHPWKLSPEMTFEEMRSYATAPSFDELLHQIAFGETQRGASLQSIKSPLVIGWGQNDRVCFPSQAKQAAQLFPDAKLHWSPNCGHFPQWDNPRETARLILASTRGHCSPSKSDRRLARNIGRKAVKSPFTIFSNARVSRTSRDRV